MRHSLVKWKLPLLLCTGGTGRSLDQRFVLTYTVMHLARNRAFIPNERSRFHGSVSYSMFRKSSSILLLLLCCGFSLVCSAQRPGSMNIATLSQTQWPNPSPTIMRTRSNERWSMIEPSRGQYSSTFAGLDQWIAAAQSHHAQLLYTSTGVPHWASSSASQPPRDLDTANETCQAPLAGVVRPNGDCMWAEFMTKFMQHVCGVNYQPNAPLYGACKVRYFETWNEFNDGQYWTSNYTDMAKMANDAATIVKKYCGDCLFLAGNTSAGGDGYNPNYYHNAAVSPRFDLALGQFLDAWHAIPNATLPNAVSYHAYNARRTVIPYPMPETNISHSSSMCTASNTPNANCRTPIFEQTAAVRAVLAQRAWAAHLPIWDTEGGYGRNDDLTDGVNQNDSNTSMLRQAYVARWLLGMGSTGTVTNLWYVWDDPCWGTMYSTGAAATNCPGTATASVGYTPAHQAWVTTNAWLNGATFSGPCTHSGDIWRCYITKPGGYRGLFLWTTAWLASASVGLGQPSSYHEYRDLDGNVYNISGASSVTVTNRPILVD